MATVDKIRNGLIDKILSIRSKDFLLTLEKLIDSSTSAGEKIPLTDEQIIMLEMSESDIENDRTASHKDVVMKKLKWLDQN